MTGTKEPSFQLLMHTAKMEVRYYQPFVLAEVNGAVQHEDNKFRILAKYIGVFGKPENVLGQNVPMTSPVVTNGQKGGMKMAMTSPVLQSQTQSLAMTSPVLQSEDEAMAFVLPDNIKKVSEAPVPTDKRVTLKEVPARVIATKRFSGWYNRNEGEEQYKALQQELKEHNLLTDDEDGGGFEVAQYHPPFTLPFLRRNEIWVELKCDRPEVRELIVKDQPQ